ncbi:MAG TPA: hypothetical protein G4N92_08260 [Anaerolineae bacterium]|nr:hypothetical protein [Anaerolineae bacterium]
MKTISRITGWVLIVLGIIMMCSAVVFTIASMVHTGSAQIIPRFMTPRITAGVSLAMGAGIFIHGVVITALGEGLHLLIEITEKKTSSKASVKTK